jgi:histidinol dehydrogenase
LSQAEHDPLAAAILITPSERLALAVQAEVERQMALLPRVEIVRQSLCKYGRIILVEDLAVGVEVANRIAPEHLELAVSNPFALMTNITNAGAIFLGEFAPEPLGDYLAGPNHVLPTNGTARFFSPLSVRDFVKYSSFLYFSKDALAKVKDHVVTLAEREGLQGHANAVRIRFEEE